MIDDDGKYQGHHAGSVDAASAWREVVCLNLAEMFKDNVPGLELATDNMKLFQAENKTPNTFGYAQLRSIVDYLKEQTALPTLTLTVTQQVCPVY